jgi:hypothetical protein
VTHTWLVLSYLSKSHALYSVRWDDVFMPISGFQRHAFMWASCHDTDQRLMFSKNTPVPETETALVPVRSPTSVFRNLRAVAKGLLGLAFCKMPRIRKG